MLTSTFRYDTGEVENRFYIRLNLCPLMNLCNLCLLPTFVTFKPTERTGKHQLGGGILYVRYSHVYISVCILDIAKFLWNCVKVRNFLFIADTTCGDYPENLCGLKLNWTKLRFFQIENLIRTYAHTQPRSQGFSVRTRRDTRKPWSGPVNFAFWLANTILSKNNWTWQLTIQFNICIFMILVCTQRCVRVCFAK
jgi:hypothetical protein